ncbi:zinc finger FYVE domain-containing protein 16 [Cololabis saira]|uniref:zinc finger FYVE domain-containing protein 16 n=1 Tax=Cololabis saira TaxID=129043 RepID=UPI002AD1E43D|nr:zinc finger FYVE domain-containing protein 16 [Cololabis saira]
MDSFFKAAVCDLDKLLDDFELNSEEPVFLKPPAYPFSSQGSQCLSSEAPSVPASLPDLSSLHYGSTSSSHDEEVGDKPLTGVDLLSSVDHRPQKSSAPPCPDRALKPVCDLVSDTSSAILVRTNSHDAFRELDVAEKQMEEEEEEEALLVDFSSSVVVEEGAAVSLSAPEDRTLLDSGYSLSLLDVILPAALERSCESSDASHSMNTSDGGQTDAKDVVKNSASLHDPEPVEGIKEVTSENEDKKPHEGEKFESSDDKPVDLPSPSIAAAVSEAPVDSNIIEEMSEEAADMSERPEADSLSDLQPKQDNGGFLEDAGDQISEARLSAEGQHVSVEPADLSSSNPSEPSPVDALEFGFEYLPESDQAEMLVTDEELDAFLRRHVEADQRAGGDYAQPESLAESDEVVEEREPRTCGAQGREDLERLASPESDRTICVSVEGSFNPSSPAGTRDSGAPYQEDASEVSCSVTSNASQSQQSSSPDQQPSYGGARPKQPNCQRPPPAGGERGGEGEEEEREQTEGLSPDPEDEESSATSPAEEHCSFRSSNQEYQDLGDYSVGYDELSEPPPYPEELPADAASSENWQKEGVEELGSRQPEWVPDAEAPNCMKCSQKFTFTKRRHHCRACGKVYCAMCCNRRCKLKYLDKEARVCVLCFESIRRAQALERMMSPTGPSPNPNVPSEYCSTIPPLQQAQAAGTLNSPPPTVMVPVSVLKHPSNDGCPREQKRVWFADGILPNGEVADTTRLSVTSRRSSQEFSPDQTTPGSDGSEEAVGSSTAPEASEAVDMVRPLVSGPWDYSLLSGIGSSVRSVPSLLPDNEDELPPLLIATGEDEGGDVLVEESPAPCQILHLLEEGGPRPLTFALNANLLVNVKLVTYSGKQCWCFGSNGLQALGQREVVFLLECLPEEKTLPRDLFSLYLNIYQDAQKGKFVENLDNVTFTSSFMGSKDHAGILFFSPTCQPLDGLAIPPPPFLFGLLVQKLEVPWAKVFPLRLLLRLGAEYAVYPTTLTSIRFRESVYRETGHTIMNLLADLRNYQYSLSVVKGLRIHMEMGHSYIDIPKSSFSEMQKVVNASNEHVISIGATFSSAADSHLVCFQNEEGNYQTQANSMPGKTRTVTGASFVVFNGALKASSGFIAKSSIVEDGLMVQIPPETMEALRSAFRDQTDFHIPCGKNDGGEIRENVTVRWVDWTSPVNTGRTSGVDGRPLDGVHSVGMQQDAEFELDGRTIRCTEVFYQLKSADCSLPSVLSSCSVFQKEIALATCSALTPRLAVLASSGINSLSLRISTQADMVEYQAGSGGRLLPQRYMNEMDGALIPVIHGGSTSVPQTAMDMEFVFYITHAI